MQRYQNRIFILTLSWQNGVHKFVIQKRDGQKNGKTIELFSFSGDVKSPSPHRTQHGDKVGRGME